ncbi:hypothetical protein GQ651_09155 [Alphaproteobacteria bacterium GH1-50]|uniref:Bacterial Ig-like domain-containing protein n=1 Tax=Kangsaoukella pontilimi TaxID=2691042 RepID=A0A7C9MD50_9RHOB|nr:Ig-like domain-containing protein [Kangsaoukella pontilimi]MXQ08011.1 hypothetical protein [Kangsaoukella pontilimi]
MLDNRHASTTFTFGKGEVRVALDRGTVLNGVFLTEDTAALAGVADRRVYVPRQGDLRARFLRDWARKNMRRAAAGLGTLTLVLPLAGMAQAQDADRVDLSTVDGVVATRIDENGDLIVTLENGQTLTLGEGTFLVGENGEIIVTAGTADQIAAAAIAEGGAGSGMSGILAGGVALGALAGGGGGGGDSGGGDPAPEPDLAYVVDGYLSGAQVFGDANNNGVFDTGETTTTTAADGSFDSSLFADDVPLVAVGGIDISTGEAFTGTLKAPAGSSVVTPLTTVVQAIIEADTSGTLTPEQAAANLATSLGLSGDLLNDDPSALAEAGDLSQLQAAAKIAAVINLVSAAAPSDPEGAVDAVLAVLAEDLTDGVGGDPFDDPSAIEAALAAAGDTIEVTSADLAEALVGAAAEIDAATDLAGIETSQTVVQGTLTDAVTQSVGDSDGTSALSDANDDTTLYDNVVPLRPEITSFTPDTDVIGNGGPANAITIEGTARAFSTIDYQVGNATGTAQTDANGDWSFTISNLAYVSFGTEGDVTPVITATSGGITSGAAIGAPTYTVDGAPPEPLTLVSLPNGDDAFINAAEIVGGEFVGQTEPGAEVTITLNGGPEVVVIADQDGLVTVSLDGGPLGDLIEGLNQLNTLVRDSVGNVASGNLNVSFRVDTIAPDAPVGSFDDVVTDGTIGSGFRGAGTGTAGEFVRVELRQDGQDAIQLGTTQVQGDGTWGFVSTLTTVPDGSYDVVAIAIDAAGNETEAAPEPVLIDRGAPAAPLIFVPPTIGPDDVVDGFYTVNGFAEVNSTVIVTIDGVVQPDITADANGDWSILVAAEDGTDTITAIARDAGGNESPQGFASTTVNVDPPVIGATSVDAVVNAAEAAALELTGSVQGATGVTIEIVDGGGTVVLSGSATPDGSGNWADTLSLTSLDDGAYTVRIIATDGTLEATDNAAASLTLDRTAPAAPVLVVDGAGVDSVVNITEEAAATLSITAEPDTDIAVTIGGAQQVVTTDANGEATVSLDGLLADGVTAISATQADAAGNVSAAGEASVTADLTAPDAPTIDAITGDNVITADEAAAAVFVTGTGTNGDMVELFIDGASQGTDTVSGGVWSIELTVLADGDYIATSEATDEYGNVSTGSAPVNFSVVPNAPTIGIDALTIGGVANADEIASPVTVTGTSTDATSVSVRVMQGDTQIGEVATATLNTDNGSWIAQVSLSVPDGSYTIEATATDGVTPVTTSTPIEIDATAPAAPVLKLTGAGGDTVVNIDEEAGATLEISGEANTETTVTIGGVEQTVTTDGTGSATISLDGLLSDGSTAISATQTDAAGNVSAAGNLSVTADLTAPAAPVISLVDTVIDGTEIGAVTISGSGAEAGATVRLSSTLFDTDIDVVADGSGNWTTGALDLTGAADAVYSISAVVIDDAGNASTVASADLTIDAVPDGVVTFTLEGGEQEGDLVIYDAIDFGPLLDPTEDPEGGGNVSNVPAGTEVTVRLTGVSSTGPFDETYGPFLTDANGDFVVSIPDADLISFDGMTEAGTITFSAAGETLTLALLINSEINADGSTVFNIGTTAVDPIAAVADAVTGEVSVDLRDGEILLNDLGLIIVDVTGPPEGFDYQVAVAYDGVSATPVELYAFDGGASTDVPALSSQLFIRDDALYVLQANISGTLPTPVTQGESPLYTLYRVPSGSIAAALPDFGTADNFDTSAAGVVSFDIALTDIDPDYAGGALASNDVFLPLDLSDGDSAPVVLFFREDQDTLITSEAYLVRINPSDGTVESREVDISAYVDGSGRLDEFPIEQSIVTDPFTGEYLRIDLQGFNSPEGHARTVSYDYNGGGFLTLTTTGTAQQTDVMVADGGILEFIDGGGDSGTGQDNDFMALGNTIGDESAINITVTGGQVTISIDRDVFLNFVANTGTVPNFAFDVFWTGSASPTGVAGFGTYTSNGTEPVGDTTAEGFNYARFSVDIDAGSFNAAGDGSGPLELVTLDVSGVDGSDFYGFGWNLVEFDELEQPLDPRFDGFQKVDGVDGSGAQFVVMTDSQFTSGFDIVQGFDLGADGDVIQVFAQFPNYQGTAVERIGEGETNVSLAADTGIVIFEGLVGAEDADVIAMAEARITGLVDKSIIAVTADDSGLFVWSLAFDGAGNVSTDSFLRVDNLNYLDLPDFNLNTTDIELFLPEV